MVGHWHDPTAGTQNQGNHIGDRACVRQSKLYRRYESGNAVKDLLGQGSLKWDENKKQGAYSGQKVYDHMKADHSASLKGSSGAKNERSGSLRAAAAAQGGSVGELLGGGGVVERSGSLRAAAATNGGSVRELLGGGGGFASEHAAVNRAGSLRAAAAPNGGTVKELMGGGGGFASGHVAASSEQSRDLGMPASWEWRDAGAREHQAAQPAHEAQGAARGGRGGGVQVEVVLDKSDHQFGKTTSQSVLTTRPW